MIAVDTIRPIRPEVKSPIKIESPEFTVTFPNRIVHNNKFPYFLSGKILAAYLASIFYSSLALLHPSSGSLHKSSRFLTSNPNNPRFSPENAPDIMARITIRPNYQAGTSF